MKKREKFGTGGGLLALRIVPNGLMYRVKKAKFMGGFREGILNKLHYSGASRLHVITKAQVLALLLLPSQGTSVKTPKCSSLIVPG